MNKKQSIDYLNEHYNEFVPNIVSKAKAIGIKGVTLKFITNEKTYAAYLITDYTSDGSEALYVHNVYFDRYVGFMQRESDFSCRITNEKELYFYTSSLTYLKLLELAGDTVIKIRMSEV